MAKNNTPEINVGEIMALIRQESASKKTFTPSPKNLSIDEIMGAVEKEVNERRQANTPLKSTAFSALDGDPRHKDESWPECPEIKAPLFSAEQEFACKNNYTTKELLNFHDKKFITNAYLAILGRQPDGGGMDSFLTRLRQGQLTKVEILGRLRFSPEGRKRQTVVSGLFFPFLVHSFFKIPVVGYLARILVGLANMPTILRNIQNLENALFVHQDQAEQTSKEITSQLVSLRNHLALIENITAEKLANKASKSDIAKLAKGIDQTLSEKADASKVAELNEQIEALKESLKPAPELDIDDLYVSFEDKFRGNFEEITARQRVYIPYIEEVVKEAGKGEIIDLGCGRGEWLELLKEQGFTARGVDSNRIMTSLCRKRHLKVDQDDALDFLRSLPANSAISVTGMHLIEHIPFKGLVELFDQVLRVLKPGGVLILETPNPRNILVGAGDFYRDPTHTQPIFPDSLGFIAETRGFVRNSIFFMETANSTFSLQDSRNFDFKDINDYINVSRDFAFIGYKP